MSVILLGFVILTTHFLEGITGFGCTVLAMPFAISLLGIDAAKPMLTLYAFLLAAYIVIRTYKSIVWNEFFRMITALILGLPVGIFIFSYLNKAVLIRILAVFMICVSIRGLLKSFGIIKSKALNSKAGLFLTFLGGIVHGAFSTGGPLIIIYASERIKNKTEFRATLCLIWTVLNFIILAQSVLSSQFTPDVMRASLYAAPFLIAGSLLGDFAHHHIKDTVFTKISYLVLLVSGVAMML